MRSTRLSLRLDGDRDLVVTRPFSASPQAVYEAHIVAETLQGWLLRPDRGWWITTCTSDPVPGGKFLFAWTEGKGSDFSFTGEYVELVPFEKIVHLERMWLSDPYHRVETRFEPAACGTLLTLRVTFPDEETRTKMIGFGMEDWMEMSYRRLDDVFSDS